MHYLDFSPHIVVVLLADELALGDGFAGVVLGGLLVGTEVSRTKLALAQLLAYGVMVLDVLGYVGKNPRGF